MQQWTIGEHARYQYEPNITNINNVFASISFCTIPAHQEASSSDHVYMCCMWQNLAVMFEFTHGRIQAAMITAEMSLQDQTAFAPQTLPQDWPICDAAVSISYDHFPQEVLVSTRATPSN